MSSDKQIQNTDKPYLWKKGAPSPNPAGRPKKELTVRTWVHEFAERRARGLSAKEKRLLESRLGYKDTWTNAQVFAAQIWTEATEDGPHREFFAQRLIDMTVGRPVPFTEMPQVIVNQQTVVQQNEPTNYEHVVTAFKAMVSAGIVPAEMFSQYAVTQGNGHIIDDDDTDR